MIFAGWIRNFVSSPSELGADHESTERTEVSRQFTLD